MLSSLSSLVLNWLLDVWGSLVKDSAALGSSSGEGWRKRKEKEKDEK